LDESVEPHIVQQYGLTSISLDPPWHKRSGGCCNTENEAILEQGSQALVLSCITALLSRGARLQELAMTTEAQSQPSPHTVSFAEEAQLLASKLAQSATDKALDLAEQQKAAVADQVEGVAGLVENVAREVEEKIPAAGPSLREAASSVHHVSSAIRDRSTEDLLQDLSEFARRRPVALAGMSLVTGFALARFLKSTAERRDAARFAASRRASGHSSANAESGSDEEPAAALANSDTRASRTPSSSDQ
jgi:hypothetical protein